MIIVRNGEGGRRRRTHMCRYSIFHIMNHNVLKQYHLYTTTVCMRRCPSYSIAISVTCSIWHCLDIDAKDGAVPSNLVAGVDVDDGLDDVAAYRSEHLHLVILFHPSC